MILSKALILQTQTRQETLRDLSKERKVQSRCAVLSTSAILIIGVIKLLVTEENFLIREIDKYNLGHKALRDFLPLVYGYII